MSAAVAADGCQRKREVKIRQERYLLPCGARDCDVCGARWQQDQRVRAVAASEQLDGDVALITITAPGSSHFGWGPAGSYDSPKHQKLDWNRSARRRFRRLHLHAARPCRDWARAFGVTWRLHYRSWEYQKRKLLHAHLVLPYGTWEERWCTDLYLHRLYTLAASYDFGYVLGGDTDHNPARDGEPVVKPAGGAEVARYVCKYVASVGSGKDSMASVAQRTSKRGSVLYIDPRLMRASGVSMSTLRARRRIWARHPWARETRSAWRVACTIDALQRGNAPLTRASEDGVREQSSTRPGTRYVLGATGEVVTPTPAPPPLSAVDDVGPAAAPEEFVVVVLASVWLGDPERPELGPVRCQATVCRWR